MTPTPAQIETYYNELNMWWRAVTRLASASRGYLLINRVNGLRLARRKFKVSTQRMEAAERRYVSYGGELEPRDLGAK